MRERARLMGLDGATVSRDGRRFALGLPADAPSGVVAALTARGALAIVSAHGAVPIDTAPVLTGDDVAAAGVVEDAPASVVIDFTPAGEQRFRDLTRAVARAGALAGEPPALAVRIDGRLLAETAVDPARHPADLDGRSGLVVPVPPDRDPAIVAAQIATGPLPLRLSAREPAVDVPPPLAEAPYLGVACPRADRPRCDRVGLSVTLAAPATAVRATVADATALLDDPVWSGPARDGTRTLFAGFLMVPGLAPDAPSWAGDPPVTARVVLEITGADGLVATVTTEVPLRPGWG